jgi:hypothetical protein
MLSLSVGILGMNFGIRWEGGVTYATRRLKITRDFKVSTSFELLSLRRILAFGKKVDSTVNVFQLDIVAR